MTLESASVCFAVSTLCENVCTADRAKIQIAHLVSRSRNLRQKYASVSLMALITKWHRLVLFVAIHRGEASNDNSTNVRERGRTKFRLIALPMRMKRQFAARSPGSGTYRMIAHDASRENGTFGVAKRTSDLPDRQYEPRSLP